jgi:hypothetical protein
MEKKMRWSISKLSPYLFYVLTLTFDICACGTNNTHDFERKQSTTGTYQPVLVFPSDIPREEATAQAITGIDCEAAPISTIEFTFSNSSHGPYVYACEDHEAHIKGIPAGKDIRVDVYAYDDNHAAVLYGFEITDIHTDQVTEGGEIEMKSVDDDNDSQTAPTRIVMTPMRILTPTPRRFPITTSMKIVTAKQRCPLSPSVILIWNSSAFPPVNLTWVALWWNRGAGMMKTFTG